MDWRRWFRVSRTILLLRFEGPIQSWGTRSRWDVRDSGSEPTKSGVIGLIGCALGLRRNDRELERFDQDLLFGVRVENPGVLSTDFHTVTGYHRTAAGEFKHGDGTSKSFEKAQEHDENTIVSTREYLHDAAFLVALALKPEHAADAGLLGELAKSLQNSKWPLYLGRKCCVPSRPVFERLTEEGEYQDLESALRDEPWSAPRTLRQRKAMEGTSLIAWIETPDGEFERQDAMRLNQLRFYDFRRCTRIEIPIPEESLEGRPVA